MMSLTTCCSWRHISLVIDKPEIIWQKDTESCYLHTYLDKDIHTVLNPLKNSAFAQKYTN